MRDPEFTDQPEFSLHFDAGREKPRTNFWKRLSRGMELLIYVLLVMGSLKLFGPEWRRRDDLEAERQRLVHIRDEKESRLVRLRQEHRLLKTDKEFLESVARDRLNLQREGEHIVRIERGEPK